MIGFKVDAHRGFVMRKIDIVINVRFEDNLVGRVKSSDFEALSA